MPLLVCPSCEAGMSAVARNGVEIDVCTSCRGVWLDRGELEKLLVQARKAAEEDTQASERFGFDQDRPGEARRAPPPPSARVERRRDDDDDDDDWNRGRGDDRRKRKSKLFDLLDIFD